MKEDWENYLQLQMGLATNVVLTPGCLPSKLDCQEDERKRLGDASTLPVASSKRQKFELLNIQDKRQVTAPETSDAYQDQPETTTKDDSLSMTFKSCIVRYCINNSLSTPDKMFVSVPSDIKVRFKWIRLAGRNPYEFSNATKLTICEDHFNVS